MTYNSAKRLLDLFIGIRGTKAVGKIVTSDSFYGLLKSSVFPAENISLHIPSQFYFKGLFSIRSAEHKARKTFHLKPRKVSQPGKNEYLRGHFVSNISGW